MRAFLVLCALVVLVACGAAVWGWNDYRQSVSSTVAAPSAVEFTIERGWSARRVSNELAAAGLIDKPHWFEFEARRSGKAAGIRSGEYVIEPGTTVAGLLDVFEQGRTREYAHTIIEGNNFREMLTRVAGIVRLEHTLDAQASFDERGAALMEAIGYADLHPEGQFFADTYRFPTGTSDVEYFARAKRLLDKVLAEEWEGRTDGLPIETPYEALILASIVEKETAVAAERPLIAGVFMSRLNKGMRLQTDPTVIYGIGESFDGDIRRSDLTTDTPYNTYTRSGLPPTPISMVGREAIHAVMHPESTTKLYFVSKGDGTHQFSETLEQHNAAVRKYQLGQ
jgi:UPF0755 protein